MPKQRQSIEDLFKAKKPKIATKETKEKFEEKMMEIQLKEKEKEAQVKAASLGLPYIDLKGFPISPETLTLLTEEQAKRLQTVCFFYSDEEIRLGAVDPTKPEIEKLLKQLEEKYHASGKIYLISQHSFDLAFHLYEVLPKPREVITGVEITEEDIKKYEKEVKTFKDLDEAVKRVSITDMLALIIAGGIKSRASDIHVEAEEKEVKLRYRIDGILHEVANLAKETWPKIVARIKLLAKLKINITDRPQDGRYTIHMTKEKIDVRVSCVPTKYGESVVMRLLMPLSAGLTFEDLGLRGRAFDDLEKEIKKPNGMLIVTGPTGCGKTTTLYAVIKRLSAPENKIFTLEDPIEYELPGINQSQIDLSKDYTFVKGLRSILRQDPDMLMVGEIRDLETAEIALNAALTGHLVATTLHTNNAAGALPRLLSIGVKPFLIPPALNAIVGERLVRRICTACKKEVELDSKTLSQVVNILAKIPVESASKPKNLKKLKFYKGGGCEECQGLGYKGRIGLFEVIVMHPEYEPLILSGQVSEFDIQKIAVKHGMVTIIQDGLLKATDGITTAEEVLRVAKDVEVK